MIRTPAVPTLSRRTAGASVAALVCLLAAGCGGGTVDRAALEQQVTDQLTATVGQQAPDASCPEALRPEVGATTRCEMVFPDAKLGITVRVKAVHDGKVDFDITADDKPQPLDG